ncbi:hypothetical protein acdb102_35240 [Acidothermaceae bacterium B102]|nr:hypothetical protein acdb102_35240 [Acidothermaceae bacterium B102]
MRSLIRRARSGSAQDEGSGLILVFLVMLISSALSLVLLEGAVSMAKQTSANNKRVTSLSAAQAGLDAGLGQIRDAVNILTGTGDVSAIPCTVAGGQVGGTNNPSQGTTTGSYTVTVAYFASDPTAQSDLWRSNSANQINCPSGSHPDKVPSFALIRSTGVSAAGKPRSVQSTYIFTTSNQNISGGLIHVAGGGQSGIPDLCPDAGSAHPSVGDLVTMQTCDANDQGQRWAYQSDLSLLLTSTTNDVTPKTPMCIQASGTPTAPSGTVLKMASCTGQPVSTTPSILQQFSYDDNGQFESSNYSGTTPKLSGYCWKVTSPNTIGSGMTIGGCGQAWRPEAAVGAGMAGAGTSQVVNYQEFGRCIDATNQDPNYSFMIAYPCKQSPNPASLTWNQLYSWNSTTKSISTHDTANGITYCLTSPMAQQATPTVPGPFVRLNPCPSTTPLPANMQWNEIFNTGNYLTSWVIQDGENPALCLGLGLTGTGTPSASGLGEWDSLYVQTCDGSLEQKWNAPPNVPAGSLTGYTETTTSGG